MKSSNLRHKQSYTHNVQYTAVTSTIYSCAVSRMCYSDI